jgi:16S rRNA (guanine966-N2)-methyltransferase
MFSALEAALGPLDGLRVLDLYAGTGALGLEALSRGAASAVLVESDRRASQVLRSNIDAVGLPGAEVVAGRVEQVVQQPAAGTAFDLVLADPPYDLASTDLAAVLAHLIDGGWVANGSWAVIERARRDVDAPWPPPKPDGRVWVGLRERTYGDTTLWYGRVV